MSSYDELERAFNAAFDLLGGKLDILVNNVGVQRKSKAEFFPQEDWKAVLNVNLEAVFSLSQLADWTKLA